MASTAVGRTALCGWPGLNAVALKAAAAAVVAKLSRLLHRTILLLVISLSLGQHAALGASRTLSEMRLNPAAVTIQDSGWSAVTNPPWCGCII